jgi:putative addiction module component (TIGR02574 family)
MNKTLLQQLLQLSPAERIELAHELWDSLEPVDMQPLTPHQKQEIERRYAEHLRHPERASSWEDVKKRLLARYK